MANAEARVARIFGGSATTHTKLVVLDSAEMKKKWVDLRMDDWRRSNRRPSDPDRLPAHEAAEEKARQHWEGRAPASIHAFAYGDTVYVSPELPESGVAHEVMHTKMNPAATEWMFGQVNPDTANQMNESLTEYFNSQLPTGPAAAPPGSDKPIGPEYTVGRDVLTELRDRRLGPDGDAILRRFYFEGDVKGLTDRLTATNPAGVAEFWNEYQDRMAAHEAATRAAAGGPY